MAITAKELIECIKEMSCQERLEIANALNLIPCPDEAPAAFEMPVMIPLFDPFKKMARNWFCA